MSTLRVNNVAEAGGDPVITSGVLDSGSLPAGSVLQVVSTTKTDTFTTTSTSFADVTGLSVSITPAFSSSKILIIVDMAISAGVTSDTYGQVRLLRDSTVIYAGDSAGSRPPSLLGFFDNAAELRLGQALMRQGGTFLDSPSTTSSITYKAQAKVSANSFYLNRTAVDTDSASFARAASSITVMEIAG